MPLIGPIRKYVVLYLNPEEFKPFERTRGPITIELITRENIPEVARNFPVGKVPVFYEKLRLGHIGVLARYRSDVVGYMWRRDYDTTNTVNADGYIPLKGRFSHFHFSRVSKEMRGRGIHLIMFTHLIRDAYEKGIKQLYTDSDQENSIAIRNEIKIGFHEVFRLIVIEVMGRRFPIKYLGDNNFYSGKDSLKKIAAGKVKLICSAITKRS